MNTVDTILLHNIILFFFMDESLYTLFEGGKSTAFVFVERTTARIDALARIDCCVENRTDLSILFHEEALILMKIEREKARKQCSYTRASFRHLSCQMMSENDLLG